MTGILDLYTDCLIGSVGLVTASTSSKILGISKDKISRFLGGVKVFTTNQIIENEGGGGIGVITKLKGSVKDHITFNNQDLWKEVKSDVRSSETIEPATLVVDDTIIHKPYSDENDIVCYHFDHCTGTYTKGINLLNGGLFYESQDKYIPIFAEIISKTEKFIDKDGKEKRRSKISKNELFQLNFNQVMKNHIKLDFTLFDIWFGSVDNLNFIQAHKQSYICPLKSNRKLALSINEKKKGKWYKLEEITDKLETQQTLPVWLEGSTHMSYLTKQIFTNKDGTKVVMYLITNDQNLTKDQVHTIYHRRWKVEEFHKSLKSNLGLEKSPTKNKTSQSNHIFCTILSFFKLEILLKNTTFTNHFQLKQSILIKALQATNLELQRLKLGYVPSGCER